MRDRDFCCTRRHLLKGGTMSIASLAAAWLLNRDGLLHAGPPKQPQLDEVVYDLLPKKPHFEPKAKAMISIFLVGGPSNLDLFDPKPALTKLDGKEFPGQLSFDNSVQKTMTVMGPAWKFEKRGQSGMDISELLPHVGGVADDITLVRTMVTGVNNHVPSMYALNTGRAVPGRGTLGSWLSYGLGSESQNLPAYVNLTDPGGLPLMGGENWTNGFLPSIYQGTMVRPTEPRVPNLDPPPWLKGKPQAAQLDYLRGLNRAHAAEHPGESDLDARIASYELAARMQTAAHEAFDLSGETAETKRLYGIDADATRDYGTRCLIARRLVERGVRFVQLFNHGQSWDHHDSIRSLLPKHCREVDKPSAALVTDLKRRGLLDSTVVFWGGEMGRMPVVQAAPGTSKEKYGRDHNTNGFSVWLAGGGFKGGYTHGETDELGHKPVKDAVPHTDFHATLFHLFGLELDKLTYKRGPQELTLADGEKPGKVIDALLK